MQKFKVVHDNSDSYVVRLNGRLATVFKTPRLINITNGAVFFAEFNTIQPADCNELEIIELLLGHTLDQLPIVL